MTETTTRPEGVVYIATSIDGFIARKDGAIDWLMDKEPTEDEMKEVFDGDAEDYGWADFLATIDAIVMGRATFEQVMEFGVWAYGDIPLTVLSRSMNAVPADYADKASVSALSPTELFDELGRKGCNRVYVDGGATVQSFIRAGLVGELVVTTLPVLIGEGISLFGPIDADIRWRHIKTETMDGMVKNTWRRADLEAEST